MTTLPHSIETEKALLAALLYGASIDDVEGLQPDDFYRTVHQLSFGAMVKLTRKRQPIDLASVINQLRQDSLIGESIKVSDVSALMDYPAASSLAHSVGTICGYSIRRQLITTCAKIADQARTGNEVVDLLDSAQSSIMAIGSDHAVKAPEVMAAVYSGLVEDLETIQIEQRGIGLPTGFTKLDAETGGLQRGELIILAARPSMGKTALALNIAENIAHKGNRVVFFSLEQPKKQLALRSLARATGISVSALRSGNISPDAWARIANAQAHIEGIPLLIDDRAGLHIREIQRTCRQLAKDGGLSLAVVDYLQLCHGDRAERKDLEIGQISSGLKALSKELSIPVLALSQLSREVERRNGKRPQLSDLRESGALEQDADVVGLLFNPNHYTKEIPEHSQAVEVELVIEKNRQGRTGFFKLLWRAWLTCFSDLQRQSHEE